MFWKPVVIVCVSASLTASVLAQTLQCAAIVTSTELAQPGIAAAFKEWMCTTHFVSHREFIDAGVGTGVSVYGRSLSVVDGAFSSAERSAWKQQNCSSAMLGVKPATAARRLLDLLSAERIQTFSRCRSSVTTGITCAIEPGSNSQTLTVRWRGATSTSGVRPQIRAVDVAGAPQGVSTGGSRPNDPTWIAAVALGARSCSSVAAVAETTFGSCALPGYVPALSRRVENRMITYTTQIVVPTQNLGHLVRNLQIVSRTVRLDNPLAEITGVDYTCRNPVAFDRCPWALNPDKNDTSANVVIAPDKKSFVWRRLWSGDPVDEIYTVRWHAPQAICVENCQCAGR